MSDQPDAGPALPGAAGAERERLARTSEELSSELLGFADRDGIWRAVSLGSRALLGRLPEALVGTDGLDLVHPDDRGAAARVFTGSTPDSAGAESVFRMRHSDGRHVWVEAKFGIARG